ncbi:hypothetical protein CP973_26365 [Streptomyces albofaciens JCM 4342]|uniref:hypothetical protein n=1 Tax=Streptomyces albofaciens TaxID=66866 RepID=UPI00123C5BFA|nr:hypothetical protein [Streptomyces albofaciens]KAA6212858.1 hypothetical protein CP973_26365 [Streptomyces albofaciens JCM 4342]
MGDMSMSDDMSKNRPERERRAQRAAREDAPASPERGAGEAPAGEGYVSEENGRWVSHLAKPGAGRHRKGPGPVPREDAPG